MYHYITHRGVSQGKTQAPTRQGETYPGTSVRQFASVTGIRGDGGVTFRGRTDDLQNAMATYSRYLQELGLTVTRKGTPSVCHLVYTRDSAEAVSMHMRITIEGCRIPKSELYVVVDLAELRKLFPAQQAQGPAQRCVVTFSAGKVTSNAVNSTETSP